MARVTTERRAGPSAMFLDPLFLEAVDVSRGPGSVNYGSDAFGGVINARTRQTEPGTPARVRFRGALGTGLPEKTAAVELAKGFNEGGIVLQTRRRTFDAYDSPRSRVFNSQASDSGFFARLGHRLGAGHVSVGWQSDWMRDVGRPDSRGEQARTWHPEENSHRVTLLYDLEPRAGFSKIGISSFWGRHEVTTTREHLATSTDPMMRSSSAVNANDFGIRAVVVRPVGHVPLEIGVDINGRYGLQARNSLTTFGTSDEILTQSHELAVANARRTDVGLYSSTELSLNPRVSLGTGVRLDHVVTINTGGTLGIAATANTAVSGYGSIEIQLSHALSVTGQITRGFRDPTLSDRYFRGTSGRGTATGNPRLQPERANQFDAAIRYRRGRLHWAVFWYYYRISNLVT